MAAYFLVGTQARTRWSFFKKHAPLATTPSIAKSSTHPRPSDLTATLRALIQSGFLQECTVQEHHSRDSSVKRQCCICAMHGAVSSIRRCRSKASHKQTAFKKFHLHLCRCCSRRQPKISKQQLYLHLTVDTSGKGLGSLWRLQLNQILPFALMNSPRGDQGHTILAWRLCCVHPRCACVRRSNGKRCASSSGNAQRRASWVPLSRTRRRGRCGAARAQ